MKRRGWIVWTWGKLGSLLVFMGMMVMMLTTHSFAGAASQAESANGLAFALKNLMTDTYNSVGGMSFECELPPSIEGEDYSIEVLDKPGGMAGVIVRTRSGVMEVAGGSSLALPLSGGSFGVLKDWGQALPRICIVKHKGEIFLEGSGCS